MMSCIVLTIGNCVYSWFATLAAARALTREARTAS